MQIIKIFVKCSINREEAKCLYAKYRETIHLDLSIQYSIWMSCVNEFAVFFFSFHFYYNSVFFIDMGKGITVNDLTIDDLTVIMQDKPVYTKIRMLQYTTMLQLFSEIMEDYNASSLKYQEKCQSLLQRQRSLSA